MTARSHYGALLGALLVVLLQSLPAISLEAVSYVTGANGLDANDCTRPLPCRTLAGAIAKTIAGGEIVILEPGDYGDFSIDKSITITAVQGAGVVRPSGASITINAGVSDVVTLVGLQLGGSGATGNFGVDFITGGKLLLRDCLILDHRNVASGIGLLIETNTNTTTVVSNCIFSNNKTGIRVKPFSGSAALYLDDVIVDRNSDFGVQSDGNAAFVFLNNSSVILNGTGLSSLNNGKIVSYKNNVISGNVTNGAPTLSLPLQ